MNRKAMSAVIVITLLLLVLGRGGENITVTQEKRDMKPEPGIHMTSSVDGLSDKEAFTLASQAHAAAVDIFTAAFEAELENKEKLSWTQVRSELIQYWSEDITDNQFREFYEEHLWDWGYEMGFAFPLWKPEFIEDAQVLSREEGRITMEFLAPYDYDTMAHTEVLLVYENNRWVIGNENSQPATDESKPALALYLGER
ncbi:MAG: hypothetical protein SCK29_05455 [Bacillota bacterium]|nr:hypothetical protein [Bacillota bacterium]MDW7683550.1 hypothetical protein [Bacillota bacterium]